MAIIVKLKRINITATLLDLNGVLILAGFYQSGSHVMLLNQKHWPAARIQWSVNRPAKRTVE